MDFQTSHNHPWNCVTCWGKRHALFKGTKALILQQWKNFCLLSAQVGIMKLNTHNSFIKQLHCVIATKWLQGLQRRRMKKLTQMQAQSLFITKSTMQFIFICIFYLSFLQLDGCQNTTFLVDLQLLENLNTPYDYMQQGRQLKCQMVIAKLLATLFSLCGRNSGAFL